MSYTPSTMPHVNAGLVTLPTGFNIDCQSFSIREAQATEDVTPFGTNVYGRMIGSGTPNLSGSISGFATAGGTINNPGFGKMATTSGDMGATATFTIGASGTSAITMTGPVVINDISLSISRLRAGVPVSYSWVGAGEFTTTWA